MKAAIALTIVLSLGCVSASPTFSSVEHSGKSSASSSSSSSFIGSSSSSSSSSYNFYSSEECSAVGFTIRDDLPTYIFDELEQKFLEQKCELLNSYSVYPRDIGNLFPDLQPDSLQYDIIIVGSGPAGLSSLPTLAALGKKILIIDQGFFAPACADSLYYRSSMYGSEYVSAYSGYYSGVEYTKNIYTSNVFGGLSVLDTNTWNIGGRSFYEQLSQINDEFSWEKVYNFYKGLESYKTYSKSVTVTEKSSYSSSSSSSSSSAGSFSGSSSSSSVQEKSTTKSTCYEYEYSTGGTYSIYNAFKDSYVTRTLSSVFEELGYSNNVSPFDLSPNKYSILPILGDQDRPTLFPYTVFKALEQYKNQIDLALRTTVKKIIFEGSRAVGVEVITSSGQQLTLYANDQVILSTGAINTYQLLFNSGVGPQDLLNQFNIPINFPIPSMGSGLILPPTYHGIILKFPKGYLMSDSDTDISNLSYAFGDYGMSSSLSLNYYAAYLSVQGATEANVALKFYAFSQSTSIRLKTMMTSYFQYDSYTQEYISSLISEYDILIVGTKLLNPRGRGSIYYKDSIDTPYIDLGMYSDDYDIQGMIEAIEQVKALASTQAFTSLNGELVQLPLQSGNGDFFTPEFNKQSILSNSIPSLYPSGGFPMGIDYQTAVVDKALRILGTENLRLFSSSVSPYASYSDSVAFSTFIGSYGAQIISDEYSGNIFPLIPMGGDINGISQSSSYSSRDIDISSSSAYSSTDINSGIDSSVDASVSQYSASSADINSSYNANSGSSSSIDINDGLNGVSSDVSSSQYSSSGSNSSYEADMNSGVSGSQYSSSSNNSSYEANQSSSNVVSGSNGLVSGQSSSSSFEAENASSNVSKSSYSAGNGGVQASNYEASSKSSSVSAQEGSSSYVSGGGVIY